MAQNICEYLRESAINELFKLKTIKNCWPYWNNYINRRISPCNAVNVINLGDNLSEIFRLTGSKSKTSNGENARTQSDVSAGGTAWEALVCWYLNLCLVGSRTVIIKHKKSLMPDPVIEAITVKYGNFPSNTESDLIAITFPNKNEYTTLDKFDITVRDDQGEIVNTRVGRDKFNYKQVINALVSRDFNDCEIGIIQCKTNWNDNAQIPMLWDMIYTSAHKGVSGYQILVGSSMFSIANIRKFTYSFITVPTTDMDEITSKSTCVNRIQNISGGNYWGYSSKPSVAFSIKEIFGKNFSSGSPGGIRTCLDRALPEIETSYSYFRI